MPTFLLTGVKWLGSLIGNLVGDGFRWLVAFGAYRLGKRSVRQDIAEDAAEIKDEQLDIAARPPSHRDSILDRMRRNQRP